MKILKFFLALEMIVLSAFAAPQSQTFLLTQPSSFDENKIYVKKVDAQGNIIEESMDLPAKTTVRRMRTIDESGKMDLNTLQKPTNIGEGESFSSFSKKAEMNDDFSSFSSLTNAKHLTQKENTKYVPCQPNDKNCRDLLIMPDGEVLEVIKKEKQ